MFELHEKLKADAFGITRMGLSSLLLMNDKSLPWLILVPERKGVKEIHDLSNEDRAHLVEEIALISRTVQVLFGPDKINIGALGNLVPQLHIHVIGRYQTDRAWPGPIWGTGPAQPYEKEEAEAVCDRIRAALADRPSSY